MSSGTSSWPSSSASGSRSSPSATGSGSSASRKGDTDYRISLFPMGGYVKLLGEGMFDPGRALAPDDMMSKSRGARLLVMAMGSIMNILLAVVLVAVINGIGVPAPEYQDQEPVIGYIDPGSPAEKAGPPAGRQDPEHQRPQGRDLERRRDRGGNQAGQGHLPGGPQGRAGPAGRSPDGIRQPLRDGLRRIPGQDPDPDPAGHGRLAGREGRAQVRGRHRRGRREARLLLLVHPGHRDERRPRDRPRRRAGRGVARDPRHPEAGRQRRQDRDPPGSEIRRPRSTGSSGPSGRASGPIRRTSSSSSASSRTCSPARPRPVSSAARSRSRTSPMPPSAWAGWP